MIMASCVWRNNACYLTALAARVFRRSIWRADHRRLNFRDDRLRRCDWIIGGQNWPSYNQVISTGANRIRDAHDAFLIISRIADHPNAGRHDQKIRARNSFADDFDLFRRSDYAVQSTVSAELREAGYKRVRGFRYPDFCEVAC